MKRILITTLLVLFGLNGYPQEQKVVEEWRCGEFLNARSDTLIIARIFEGKATGAINVAGTTHSTDYEVEGFKRRWDWGLSEDKTYDYAFTITPEGKGLYYDFSHTELGTGITNSMTFTCYQTKGK